MSWKKAIANADKDVARIRKTNPALYVRLAKAMTCESIRTKVLRGPDSKNAPLLRDLLRPLLLGHDVEHFAVLAIDMRGACVAKTTISKGATLGVVVSVREIIRWVYTQPVPILGVVLGHNHLTGDATPSPLDLNFTKMVEEQLAGCGLVLFDHLVIESSRGYSSLRVMGHLRRFTLGEMGEGVIRLSERTPFEIDLAKKAHLASRRAKRKASSKKKT